MDVEDLYSFIKTILLFVTVWIKQNPREQSLESSFVHELRIGEKRQCKITNDYFNFAEFVMWNALLPHL